MLNEINKALSASNTLDEVLLSITGVLKTQRDKGVMRIGYVSGIVTSMGKDKIGEYMSRLTRYREFLQTRFKYPIFAPPDIFDDGLFKRLTETGHTNSDYVLFWQKLLGHEDKYITDIFLTPRWKLSSGAKDEYVIARRVGISTHFLRKER